MTPNGAAEEPLIQSQHGGLAVPEIREISSAVLYAVLFGIAQGPSRVKVRSLLILFRFMCADLASLRGAVDLDFHAGIFDYKSGISVASKRTKPKNKRTPRRILMAGTRTYEPQPWTIPTWWLNTVFGLFLVPVAVLLTESLFTCFHKAVPHHFWTTEEFRFFIIGAAAWVAVFFASVWAFGEPRPLRVYVFGHELTHAVWVWLMGGRVMRFRVRRDGGHIITDTNNFLIALAPYFYPLYSLAVIALYGLVSVFYNVSSFTPLLFGLLGLTWAFHMSFTLWMIPKGQSDLTYHGTFFSLVVIYVMNILLLLALLILAAPEVTLTEFARELLRNTEEMSAWLWSGLVWLARGG